MSKNKLCALYTEADQALLAPVLEALRAKGLRMAEASGRPGAGEVVLVGLSERFYADETAVEELLGLLSSGAENVLPLQLDGADMPDAIKNALYARNIIPAAQRDPALLAERIIAALPQKKSRLPLILSVAGVLLLAVVGLLIWRGSRAGGREAAPVMGGEPIVLPAGLTEEDLAQIRCVAIVGEHFSYYTEETRLHREDSNQWPDMLYELASEEIQAQNRNWYWHEDGNLVSMTPYDLRFLALMPNLEELHICEAEITQAPDLSELKNLDVVWLYDSQVADLEWLGNSHVAKAQIECAGSLDFSPLGSNEYLRCAIFGLHSNKSADLSAFSPPNLNELHLDCGYSPDGFDGADLSGLAGCSKLRTVILSGLPVRDLSFLQGKTDLQELRIDGLGMTSLSGLEDLPIQHLSVRFCDTLRDVSAIGTLKRLRDLDLEYCGRVTDYTPIAGCEALEELHIQGDANPEALQDASFLSGLPKLRDIGLYACDLRDMNFLESFAGRKNFCFGFAGGVQDYSGLAAIDHYSYLHVNPSNGNFAAVIPYLENCTIDSLMLYDCSGIDLSLLPDGVTKLSICYGDLRNLSGLPPYSLRCLELEGCQYLSSLNGLEAIPTLFGDRAQLELQIIGCPRLTDYAALDGAYLENLKLIGAYYVPDLSRLRTNVLRLESIPELRDLSCLDSLDSSQRYNLELVGLDELYDLTPLRRLHGNHLQVPPQVAEQAEELVEDGNFRDYEVAYPDRGWEADNRRVELLSLDELGTLPKALLKRVERVCVVGDQLVDRDQYEIYEDWEHMSNNAPTLYLRDRSTEELTPVGAGTITDLSLFSELSGLKELELWAQPLETLDGIQNLSQLEDFTAQFCPALRDASALFSLQGLHGVCLEGSQISSIQGIQNLSELNWIDFSGTQVEDFSPLASCDFSWASEHGGLNLSLNGLNLDEAAFAALGNVPHYSNLAFDGEDPAAWQPALANSEIESFGGAGDFRSNEDLAAFAADHPELRNLWLGWMQEITDLRCLAPLENLERVSVNPNMREAIDSLNGVSYGFELRLEG